MPGQKPVAKFRAGQISAAIWENEISVKNGNRVKMLKATVQRRYKDNVIQSLIVPLPSADRKKGRLLAPRTQNLCSL